GAGAGLALSALFAVLTVGLAANQVASGLALTILSLGLSGLVGTGYVGMKRDPAPHLHVAGLSDLPVVGDLLFSQDAFVYAAILLVLGVWWFLGRTRAGLVLRAIGDDHTATHALGLPVRRVRVLAVLFGGACAGLAGAYLSLAYTPFWSPGMTAGRGWIALALVVFASWRPLR
ncbi:ABC transporter permease, partial [Methylobacterium sp. WL122]